MEEGRKVEQVHWEGGDMHTEQEGKRKKKRKKKTKSEASEEASSSILQHASVPSSYTDHTVLKQNRKENKPKDVCIDHSVIKQKIKEEKPKNVCSEHAVVKQTRKEKKPKNVNIDMHGDRSASCEGKKPRRKKVRFSDQCLEDVNIDVHGDRSASCEGNKPLHSSFEGKNEREDSAVSFRDGSVNTHPSLDEKDLLSHKRQTDEDDEIWGKRFTPEEDEILKKAVLEYIKTKGWDEQEGLTKVLDSQKHKDAHNCWADINMCLPHRPRQVVRYRAHILLEKGAHLGKWSKEEEELLKRLQGEHGHKWREISSLLNRHRTSIKEKWRSLKRSKGQGVWTQGELQRLSDMVHKCLRLKASLGAENKKSNHQILRDNINWEKIADTIGTHSHGSCCGKWYYHLQSSLVTDGHWANEDDSLLLKSLLESGACVEEEVEWDSLLDHRSGQVCSIRWKQMVKHLGENRTRQFLDKLDVLARRYVPELMETSVEDSSNKESHSGSDDISLE